MKHIALAALLVAAAPLNAATVTFSNGIVDPLTETVRIERSGPYPTGWSALPDGPNTIDHQGRQAGVYEDGGMGRLKVWFDRTVTRATIALQDVGDTRWFDRLVGRSNGSSTTWRTIERTEDGSWLYATIDFSEGDNRAVTLRTFQVDGLPPATQTRQDGFGVKVCKR